MKSIYRISVLSLMLLVCNMVGAQKVVTLDFSSNEGWNFPTEETTTEGSFTKDAVTITLKKGNYNSGYYFVGGSDDNYLRIGRGNTLGLNLDFKVVQIEVISPKATPGSVSCTFALNDKVIGRTQIKKEGAVSTIKVAESSQAESGTYLIGPAGNAWIQTIKFYGETPTAIKEVTTTKADDGIYYTLDGVKVSNPTKKGVYIKNGKKVVL